MTLEKSRTTAVFQFLTEKAIEGQTTTYEEIALATGLPASGNALGATLSPILTRIFHWCVAHGQPHLTSIVGRKSGKDKGIPGAGYWALLAEYQAFAEATDDPELLQNFKITRSRNDQLAVFDFYSEIR